MSKRICFAIFSIVSAALYLSADIILEHWAEYYQQISFIRLAEKPLQPLTLVGIMVTDSTKKSRIDAIRQMFANFNSSASHIRFQPIFFVGQPRDGIKTLTGNDVVRSDELENMDDGKTYDWFKTAKYIAREYGRTSGHALHSVFKMDTDVTLNLTRVDYELIRIPAFSYIGTVNEHGFCGGEAHCPPPGCTSFEDGCWTYMSGGFYGLSKSLVDLVTNCSYASQNKVGFEDVTVGVWIKNCEPQETVNIASFARDYLCCHSKSLSDSDVASSNFHHCLK